LKNVDKTFVLLDNYQISRPVQKQLGYRLFIPNLQRKQKTLFPHRATPHLVNTTNPPDKMAPKEHVAKVPYVAGQDSSLKIAHMRDVPKAKYARALRHHIYDC
jgi:hypothetical protein